MSTLASTHLTLMDHAKRTDPGGNIADIVEMMSQTNELLQDMHFEEGNKDTGHITTIRTGLPTVYWRMMNQGVLTSKSRTAQVEESCAMLESWSEVDKDLAELGGNSAKFRISEAKAFIEAMGQEFEATTFYGSAASPEEFVGLAARYSSLSAANGSNIISGAGASGCSSIWLIVWGSNTVFGVIPRGSKAGIQHEDLGLETVENAGGVTGAKMRAYRDRFVMKGGLVVKDWRYAVRIANIDISDLTSETSAADLMKLMIKATKRIPAFGVGRAAWYMNRTVEQMLDIQGRDTLIAGGGIKDGNIDGKPVRMFRGIPIRMADSILESEDAVS